MQITERIEKLKQDFSDDCRELGGVLYLGVNSPDGLKLPRRHVIFPPLPDAEREQNISRYTRPFPEQLRELYKYANGFNLFSWHFQCQGIALVQYLISIYGFQTLDIRRNADKTMLIPFDIVTEDLRRPAEYPHSFLKIGSCDSKRDERRYIFCDTETGEMLLCESQKFSVADRWGTVDEGLCALFDRFSDENGNSFK